MMGMHKTRVKQKAWDVKSVCFNERGIVGAGVREILKENRQGLLNNRQDTVNILNSMEWILQGQCVSVCVYTLVCIVHVCVYMCMYI